MPVYQRKTLRQHLGQTFLRDTVLGNTALSWGLAIPLTIMDVHLANTDLSGQNPNVGNFLRVASGDYRVGSVNVASGALYSGQVPLAAIASGADYEMSRLLPAWEKDAALDDTIQRIRLRQEVAIWTIDGALMYTIDGAASPAYIESVMDVYYFSNPTGTANRDQRRLDWFNVVNTPTGTELRILPALQPSQQIVMDALLAISLGASDAATVNLPDERLVLFGAEAQCWDRLTNQSPGVNTEIYKAARDDAARNYSSLAAKFRPQTAKKIQFDEPVGRGIRPWNW